MARGGSSSERFGESAEGRERGRLKDLALRRNILSRAPRKCSSPLSPCQQVAKHHGADILRKSQRKNRFLFSFPGLLAPLSAGNIGHLERMGSKNPLLYLHFPQGRMKLFGTIIYPKNRYLTLQFSRGGKNVICGEYFDNMIVFSEAWWIGKKEENPEEARLEFPKELTGDRQMDFDFKGGAGTAAPNWRGLPSTENKHMENGSEDADFETGFSDGERSMENPMEVTPLRKSERNSGKRSNFADHSSIDPVGSDSIGLEREENKGTIKPDPSVGAGSTGVKDFSQPVLGSGAPDTKTKKPSLSSAKAHLSLVQTTLSELFKKAEAEVEEDDSEDFSSTSKDSDGSDEDWAA